jgi:hypothetical protein
MDYKIITIEREKKNFLITPKSLWWPKMAFGVLGRFL